MMLSMQSSLQLRKRISLEGLTGTITWTASGEPDKEPKAVKIENGAYTAME